MHFSGTVTATYGTATARPLDNVLWQDGDSDMPGTSVGDVKQPGVRPPKLVAVDQQAYDLLQPNDWMVVKLLKQVVQLQVIGLLIEQQLEQQL